MSEKGEEYSAYRSYYSIVTTTDALLAGFTFTGITLLLTQLPDPTHISIQATLLFLTILLNLFMYGLSWAQSAVSNCIRIAPELPEAWWRWNKVRTTIALISDLEHDVPCISFSSHFSVVRSFRIHKY